MRRVFLMLVLQKWHEEGVFGSAGSVVFLPSHEIQFNAEQQKRVKRVDACV